MQGKEVTQRQKQKFLVLLRASGNVTLAAEGIKVSRKAMYKHRDDDSEFAESWDDAVAEACDRLEAEAWRRAYAGVEEPVYGRVAKDRDGQIGTIKKYSDTLMVTLLKAHKPEKYRERQDVTVNGQLTTKGYAQVSPDDWDASPTTEEQTEGPRDI